MWELGHKESWALKNWSFWTVVLEKNLENPLDFKEIQPVHPKGNQSWIFIGRWERLKVGEGDDRGWDGWMASLTQWTWVWVNSGSWWWTGRPGVLQSMVSQRVGHDWATELNWTDSRHQPDRASTSLSTDYTVPWGKNSYCSSLDLASALIQSTVAWGRDTPCTTPARDKHHETKWELWTVGSSAHGNLALKRCLFQRGRLWEWQGEWKNRQSDINYFIYSS